MRVCMSARALACSLWAPLTYTHTLSLARSTDWVNKLISFFHLYLWSCRRVYAQTVTVRINGRSLAWYEIGSGLGRPDQFRQPSHICYNNQTRWFAGLMTCMICACLNCKSWQTCFFVEPDYITHTLTHVYILPLLLSVYIITNRMHKSVHISNLMMIIRLMQICTDATRSSLTTSSNHHTHITMRL